MKPLVYIAGPYTQPDPIENTQKAIRIGEAAEALGAAVIIPHLSMLWHLVAPAPIETWYERDLDVLAHCDALVRFEGASTGADAEVVFARSQRIEVFYGIHDGLAGWLASWRRIHS